MLRKVLLVNPAYSKTYFSLPVLPAGLGYLAQGLKNNGLAYEIFDMSLGYTAGDLKEKIRAFRPELVGVSCISYMLNNTYRMVSELKRNFPGLKIIMGGPHVSSIKGDIMRECKDLDFALVGEGDRSLIDLCKGRPYPEISGLIYRVDSKQIAAVPSTFVSDLGALDFPRYEGFELDRYGYKMIGIVTSRGCPYGCIYCSCNVIGKKIRFRCAESIVEEIDYWYKRGYREFGIQEDNPTFDKNRMLEICEGLRKKCFKDLKLMCGNGVRADRVDRELLGEMKKAGFKRLAFGIESGSDKVLKAINKGTTAEVMEKAIREAVELGFFVSLFFIIGSPSETTEDVERSIRLALKYPVQSAEFFNLVPMPGSELYSWVEKNNYFIRPPKEYLNSKYHPARSCSPIFATPEFTKKERRMMLKKTHRVSVEIKKRVIREKFVKLGFIGEILANLYCLDVINRIENRILCNEFLCNTIGSLRMKIRNKFYS